MCTARSAICTCSASRSAVEYTATASTPSSCNARITRTAISPRLATRTRENISGPSRLGALRGWTGRLFQRRARASRRASRSDRVERSSVDGLELEQELAVLDRFAVPDVDRPHDRLALRLHLVHELHRLEDAQRLTRRHGVALLHERR